MEYIILLGQIISAIVLVAFAQSGDRGKAIIGTLLCIAINYGVLIFIHILISVRKKHKKKGDQ